MGVMDIFISHGVLSAQGDYKAGDQPPANGGYLEMHEWAMVQMQAGLSQVKCGRCGKPKFPQELTSEIDEAKVYNRRGRQVGIQKTPICIGCAPWLKNRKKHESDTVD